MHIPKTAGTTLNRIIDRQYPREDVFSIMPWAGPHSGTVEDFKGLPKARRASIRILRGHLDFGVHEFIPGPFTYFTFLREPKARVLSNYSHARRDPKHNLYPYMREMSLKDALLSQWPLSRAFENFQTRLISGVGHTVPFGECTRETLETAKENLQRYFSVVGVVERFDESLLLLQQRFGWGAVYYRKHNVSRRSPAAALADGETIQLIERHNQLDEALYQFAYELCAQQIEQAGEPLQQQLKWFQRMNRFVTLGLRVYWRARKVSVRAALGRAGRGEGMEPS